MKKRILAIVLTFAILLFVVPANVIMAQDLADSGVKITYSAHVQDIGWQQAVSNGGTAGTSGRSLRMEALKISVEGVEGLSVNYSAHVQDFGWMNTVSDGQIAGTTGLSKRVEAFKIYLTGENAANYDIWYRVHSAEFGWLGWTSNGKPAGTAGYSYRMEAMEIRITPKGESAPQGSGGAFFENISASYSAHVSEIGWQSPVSNGAVAGTTGQGRRVEAFTVRINGSSNVAVNYSAVVQGSSWGSTVENGAMAGTTGQAKAIEAIKIGLTGEYAENYDIWYRVHCSDMGWLGWTKNNKSAGTYGYNHRIEALQVIVSPKDRFVPGSTNNSYIERQTIGYATHVSEVGWQNSVYNGATAGIIGQDKAIQAIGMGIDSLSDIGVKHSAYVQNTGWSDYVGSRDYYSGTVGQSKHMEAIKIELTGSDAGKFDVRYRVYSTELGWLGWTKNGEIAGTIGYNLPIEAIQIMLCNKGEYGQDSNESYFSKPMVQYSACVNGSDWFTSTDFNPAGKDTDGNKITAIKCNILGEENLAVESSGYVKDSGWTEYTAGTLETEAAAGFEQIKFKLSGENADKYDLWYNVCVENGTWLGWTGSDTATGTIGYDYPIQSVAMALTYKDSCSLSEGKSVYTKVNIEYSTANSSNTWSDISLNGATSGNLNSDKIIHFKVGLQEQESSAISYRAHISNNGWTDTWQAGNEISGFDDEQIEAVQIKLNDTLASEYSVYYRTYVQNFGWLAWTNDGGESGSVGYGFPIQAIEIKVVENGMSAPQTGVSIKNKNQEKALFAIDAGHGGRDPGSSWGNRIEANDTIVVASELQRILLQQGFQVFMIDRNLSTDQRPLQANAVNADMLVSLHRDSVANGSPSGISIWTHEPNHTQQIMEPGKTYAPNEHPNKHDVDKLLVEKAAQYLGELGKTPVRGAYYGSASAPSYQDYFINRLSNMPSCIIELGFICNSDDNYNFDTYYKLYAKSIARAMIESLGFQFCESRYTY